MGKEIFLDAGENVKVSWTVNGMEPSDEIEITVSLLSTHISLQLLSLLVGFDLPFYVQVEAITTGWVGIGLSPNGAMTGADIIVAWVADGTGYITVSKLFF